jgi:glycine/D-amino acid oxidase-like deaminating enzyme
MPTIDVLIIGQGICGSFLSFELERAGLSYLVIDEARPFAASRVAAGLINPVTGRRLVTTWMIDELLAFAQEAYGRLGGMLGDSFWERISVTDLFPTAQMRLAFLKRLEEEAAMRGVEEGAGRAYLHLPADEQRWNACFHYELGYGVIHPCYLVDMPGLLAAARKRMREQGVLREERFEKEELQVGRGSSGGEQPGDRPGGTALSEGVRYGDIHARRVVFCDGIESFASPYFSRLPFAPNKGEVLIVDIPGLAAVERTVFKKGITLAPWQDGLYWVGSSYEWSFETGEPTEVFRRKTEAALREWVKLPFRVVDHIAAVRPATLERRPFVGFHPLYPAVGILNGMGTKGCSLAPYFARQLADFLRVGKPIQADADIRRFVKVLSRG